jgi:outer membrane lipoprotein SlyB
MSQHVKGHNMKQIATVLISCSIAGATLLGGCVRIPPGPNVMVMPGAGKSFDAFEHDDVVCRDWAAYRTHPDTRRANDAAVANAAVGTVVGAATGAAIGAAAGDPAMGAAVGASVGLLGGSVVGADASERENWSLQRRYDAAYMQCMYAKGNQVPVPRSSRPTAAYTTPPPPPPSRIRRDLPPPPPGRPPLPPPDVAY